eukprot:snap_masked-scaffold9_size846264-processed-gene-2.1 protein:Tk08388 transcript:snap_masked-scaffold9_size846264-processed-gene-2.1-mRNA-1 annotation:"Calmodulin"
MKWATGVLFCRGPGSRPDVQFISKSSVSQHRYKDRSGSISTKELLYVMRSIGQNPTEDEIQDLIMESDLNGDGTIDFKEFLAMMKRKSAETDQTEALREAFRIFDKDRSGFIEIKEIISVTSTLGQALTREELEAFMKEADLNGDGKIDYEEFAKDLKEAFKIFDKNKNGYIEVKELKTVTTMLGQKLTDDEFEEFWKEADVNHDGKLDYNEFLGDKFCSATTGGQDGGEHCCQERSGPQITCCHQSPAPYNSSEAELLDRCKKIITFLKKKPADQVLIFSDEKIFTVDAVSNSRTTSYIAKRPEDVHPCVRYQGRSKHPAGAMMLGVVGSYGKAFPPIWVKGNKDSTQYKRILAYKIAERAFYDSSAKGFTAATSENPSGDKRSSVWGSAVHSEIGGPALPPKICPLLWYYCFLLSLLLAPLALLVAQAGAALVQGLECWELFAGGSTLLNIPDGKQEQGGTCHKHDPIVGRGCRIE